MADTSELARALLQTGVLVGVVLVAQIVAVRHLPVESIPGVLRGRVALCSRIRPYLLASVLAMVGMGLFLTLVDWAADGRDHPVVISCAAIGRLQPC